MEGERYIYGNHELDSFLHLKLGQPNEKEAQGRPTGHKIKGEFNFKLWRTRHPSQEDYYNAWEEDIAVVNIFFGKGTVMGEKDLIGKIYLISC